MLTADNLECIRNDQVLFTHLSFKVVSGQILHVVGSNGSGKSSLLQILIGLSLPQAGKVCWENKPISQDTTKFYQQLCYLGHRIGVKNNLTVLENLHLFVTLSDSLKKNSWELILKHFDLWMLKNTLCRHLSAGQRQRVALTRLLLSEAKLWVLDEPFTALDFEGCAILQNLFLTHSAKGGLIILTSHQSLALPTPYVKQLALAD